MRAGFLLLVFLSMTAIGESHAQSKGTDDWLIPEDLVFSGGVPKDGIPALTDPDFISASAIRYLSDEDLVIGINIDGEVRAYPHKILDRHEIINDDVNGMPVSVTYCPLTGSGMVWDRTVNGQVTEFGVSGLLYNSNLITYDRTTDSFWSQMTLQCVSGTLRGEHVSLFPAVETRWDTWKEMYPESLVVSSRTGIYKSYDRYPYFINGRDYRKSSFLMFPVSNKDTRLPSKEKVHGIIGGGVSRAFPINSFSQKIQIINEDLGSVPVVVAGSRSKHFAVSYIRRLDDGTILDFSPVHGDLPIIMEDGEGTRWDIFGKAVSGPRSGMQLKKTRSFDAYWFAWGTFHPGLEIYRK